VLALTFAAEIDEIGRFPAPQKFVGYSGLCPRVVQSGDADRRGPLSKHGPTCLRWALIEATMHALRHPVYSARHQRTKRRLAKQRGAKIAQVDVARRLAHVTWHMLTRNQEFAPRGAASRHLQRHLHSGSRPTVFFGPRIIDTRRLSGGPGPCTDRSESSYHLLKRHDAAGS
jgi:Transposase IS116/IS110/IS902 family